MGLVHGAEIIDGQQVQVGDAQLLHVVQAGGNPAGGFGAGLGQAQELARVLDAGIRVYRQIPDVQLIDNGVIDALARVGVGVALPALRVGAVQVDDHGPDAVDAGGPGVGVAGLRRHAVDHRGVGVVHPVEIAALGGHPGAVGVPGHLDLLRFVVLIALAGGVQVQRDRFRGGRPHPEGGGVLGPHRPQVVPGVGVFLLKALGGVEAGYAELVLGSVIGDGVALEGVQLLCQGHGVGKLPAALRHIGHGHAAVLALHGEHAVQAALDFPRHGDGNGAVMVVERGAGLGAQHRVTAILLGMALHPGFHIDMYRAGHHFRDVDELVHVHILGPVRLADDVSHAGDARSDRHRGDHLTLFLHKRRVDGVAPAQFPEPNGPVLVVGVLAVVVDLEDQISPCLRGHGPGNAGQDLRGQQDHRHEECACPSFHVFLLLSFSRPPNPFGIVPRYSLAGSPPLPGAAPA